MKRGGKGGRGRGRRGAGEEEDDEEGGSHWSERGGGGVFRGTKGDQSTWNCGECQMWQEDLRAASDIFQMAHLSSDFEIPSASRNLREELLTKPRQPTSNGKAWVAQPLTRHSVSRDMYLTNNLRFENFSLSGQVSSPQILIFLEGDQMTISGRRQ